MIAFQKFIMEASGMSCNLLVLDEFLENVDTTGAEIIIDIINNMFDSENIGIYIITHNNSLKSHFNSVITVEKENGCSTLKIFES
jgi:ABC-type Mn2+/Zn2+ transport system ATPase subunit